MPDAGKLARPVLKGEWRGNPLLLPDTARKQVEDSERQIQNANSHQQGLHREIDDLKKMIYSPKKEGIPCEIAKSHLFHRNAVQRGGVFFYDNPSYFLD